MTLLRLRHKKNGQFYVSHNGKTHFHTINQIKRTVKNWEWYLKHYDIIEYKMVEIGKVFYEKI